MENFVRSSLIRALTVDCGMECMTESLCGVSGLLRDWAYEVLVVEQRVLS